MRHLGSKFGVCVVAATLFACGPKNNGENNGETNGTTNGATNGATNGMPNGDTNNPPGTNSGTNSDTNNNNDVEADVMEMEPNGFEDTPTAFDVGQTLGGTIATGAADTADFDVFSTELTAGTVIEFGLADAGPGIADTAVIVLQDEQQQTVRVLAVSDGPATRQTYIPADGVYTLAIWDERAEGEMEHGGDDAWYVLSTEEVTVTPEALDVPGSVNGDQSDGSIQMYSWTADTDGPVVAETTADREPITSGLDTVVLVLNDAGELVGYSDDFLQESFDSRAVFEATTGTDYQIIVDAYAATTQGNYLLETSLTDDDPSIPTELELDTPGSGVIDAVDGEMFDTDYFNLNLMPGQTARVTITGAGGLQPAISAVVDSFFGPIAIATGYPLGTDAAIEFAHPASAEEAGDYLITVDDLRNVEDPENPADEGEAGYTYELTATTTTWTPSSTTLPLTADGSIPGLGNYVWYEFTIPAGHMFSADVETTASDFEPHVATLNEGGTAFAQEGPVTMFPAEETTVTMGVRDAFFRGGTGYDFTPNFFSVDPDSFSYDDVAESEPNDDSAAAQDVTPPVAITGVLDGAGQMDLKPDWFAISASAGDVIGAYTAAGDDGGTDDADTILKLIAPDGTTVVAENDDYPGQEMTFFSSLLVTVEQTGDYYIVVEPYCTDDMACSGNGDYTANVFLQ
jgi:hypothetical protein